ncbi:MAG: ribonuclease H-like YkuK family protein [Thermodesulfobacteriota bacterium]
MYLKKGVLLGESIKTYNEPSSDRWSFLSPTYGRLSFDELFISLTRYIEEESDLYYNLIIGSDSFMAEDAVFVTAIVIHRVGHGGRYFYTKMRHRKIESLKQRIFYETSLSLEVAGLLCGRLAENGYSELPVEIHLDVGNNGATKEIIKEVVGMVTGSGYAAVTKPDSYGAFKVADRHSK